MDQIVTMEVSVHDGVEVHSGLAIDDVDLIADDDNVRPAARSEPSGVRGVLRVGEEEVWANLDHGQLDDGLER
jgi:hypothetical protein